MRLILVITIVLLANVAHSADTTKIYVETPSLCTVLDRVDGDCVYLKSTQPNCAQIKGKALVNVAADAQDLDVYVDGKFWEKINIADNGSSLMDAVNSATGHADKMRERLNDQHNQHEEWGKEKASEIAAFYYSDAYQHRIAAETERLKSTVFRDVVSTSGNPDNEAKKNDAERGNHWLKASERLYLFISSSVPAETLRAYARAIDKIGDPRIVLVMNGFAGGVGNFKKMLDFIVSFKAIDPECNIKRGECQFYKTNLQIDPLLFRKYEIDVVPAVVYAVGSNLERPDVPDHNADVASYYMMKGDASLEYYLDSMQRESKSASLTKLLERLRSGFYDN